MPDLSPGTLTAAGIVLGAAWLILVLVARGRLATGTQLADKDKQLADKDKQLAAKDKEIAYWREACEKAQTQVSAFILPAEAWARTFLAADVSPHGDGKEKAHVPPQPQG